ncbi:unnamed protein product [Caenorhabditis nigoni]
MENKQLLYENVKTVLTYMEPNYRFSLALKIPSIRKAEKAAPLHINLLEIHDNRFVLNGTEYKMVVYLQCQGEGRSSGGYQNHDIDEHGDPINVDESIQPGDIKLGDPGSVHSLRWLHCPKRHIDWSQHGCPPPKMYSLPCDHYIRLFVSGSMYQFPYESMKLYQLMKRLITIFLGNRGREWTVKHMNLQTNLLRWPVSTRKPIVQSINIGNYSQLKMNILDSIIDSSVPLNNLLMSVPNSHDRIIDHPLLMHADQVTITNYPPDSFFSDLFSIQAQTVVIIDQPSSHLTLFNRQISEFMEKKRPIGTRFSFFVTMKNDFSRYMCPELIEKSRDCIKLAVGNDAMVVFQFSETYIGTWFNIETCPRIK